MKQTKKGNNWYFGTKAHIGVDAPSDLVHSVVGTAANVNDLNVAGALLHGDEEAAFGDAGYQGVHKRPEAEGPTWHVAMRRSKRKKLNPFIEPEFVAERVEKMKASIRAKVEHPFRVLKRQFGFTKVRYRGLAKDTGAARHAVRVVEPVDGAPAVDGSAGMSASATRQRRWDQRQEGHQQALAEHLEGCSLAARVVSSLSRCCNSRCADGMGASLPTTDTRSGRILR